MITLWKKKTPVVEAVKWTGKNAAEIKEFCGYNDVHMMLDNSYIVKDDGKFTLYSEHAFHEVYERHLELWEDNI